MRSPQPYLSALNDRPWLCALACVVILAALAFLMGFHEFVPILSKWESLQFAYVYSVAEPYLSFAIGPRANIGGTGYPLLDIGHYLTDWFGLSLTGFRLIAYVYALLACAGMIVVFGRWFGVLPAILGVSLTALSTGFVFFSNQVLVLLPSLLLCVLLVERCQRLSTDPDNSILYLIIGAILSLMIIHYGMGRFFAVGWLLYFFTVRTAVTATAMPTGFASRKYIAKNFLMACALALVTIVILCVLDFRNIKALADPWNIFFPRIGTEVEMAPEKLGPAIYRNLILIIGMLVPQDFSAGDPGPLLTGARSNILNIWHIPILLIGVGIAIRRTFHHRGAADFPYLSLHVIAALSVGLTLFSQHYGDVSTISPFRVFGGFFAFAGYITVFFRWLCRKMPGWSKVAQAGTGALTMLLFGFAIVSLSAQLSKLHGKIEEKARLNLSSGTFTPVPKIFSFEEHPQSYLHARLRKLAEMVANKGVCDTAQMSFLPLLPRIVLNEGKYDELAYLSKFNLISSTFAVYLRTAGVNAAYFILHDRDPQPGPPGNGFAGRPRTFSGPITWKDQEIHYRNERILTGNLHSGMRTNKPRVIIGFSQAEAEAAHKLSASTGQKIHELPAVTSLRDLTDSLAARDRDCPVAK